MAKQKYYVVWSGKVPGIYTSWDECRKQVEGQEGSKYKSFKTMEEAQDAFSIGYDVYRQEHPVQPKTNTAGDNNIAPSKGVGGPAINESIAVDAACSGNPGAMEYRGVYLKTGRQLFHVGPMYGTNNIGEFLALVHGLAFLKQKGMHDMPIYSDSRNAQLWVRAKKCKTKLERNDKSEPLYQLIERAENWLKSNTYSNPIIKWPTEEWGEIPADFGRK